MLFPYTFPSSAISPSPPSLVAGIRLGTGKTRTLQLDTTRRYYDVGAANGQQSWIFEQETASGELANSAAVNQSKAASQRALAPRPAIAGSGWDRSVVFSWASGEAATTPLAVN